MTDSSPTPQPAAPSGDGTPSKDDCTMAMLCHLLAILTGFLGPLIIWLIKKDSSKFVDDQGKEALNFQITMFIGYVIAGTTTVIVIGCFLAPALMVANLVLCIMATLKAKEGVAYRYPFALRLIK